MAAKAGSAGGSRESMASLATSSLAVGGPGEAAEVVGLGGPGIDGAPRRIQSGLLPTEMMYQGAAASFPWREDHREAGATEQPSGRSADSGPQYRLRAPLEESHTSPCARHRSRGAGP